jgi:hypothetical protein
MLPAPLLAFLVVLVLGGVSVGVYAAARALQRAGAVRARSSEVEHFVLSLRAVRT